MSAQLMPIGQVRVKELEEIQEKALKQNELLGGDTGSLGQEPQIGIGNLKSIIKRDGRTAPFDPKKIVEAIFRAGQETGEFGREESARLAFQVVEVLEAQFDGHLTPSVEQIQDIVEVVLMKSKWVKTAKAYIVYREEHAKLRSVKKREIPERVKQLADESKKYFRNSLSEFVYYRSYSRWLPEENRRETWVESVDRYISFMKENIGGVLTESDYQELREGILRQEAMPSMRLLWSAGKAARATNAAAYNCSYTAPKSFQDIAEIMYLSMAGAGVGFSVEQQTVQLFPPIQRQTGKMLPAHEIVDSKEGWCDSLVIGMKAWYEGSDVPFDYSQLRPEGARLLTMGGKSSGPDPLRSVLTFVRAKILENQGRRLRPIDVHDIICKIGDVVVMGGVRRTALISLSDLDDQDMRLAKYGQFWLTNPQRSMSNNSAVYLEKPSSDVFLDEWMALTKSRTGERGIFNRAGLKSQVPIRRWKVLERDVATTGTNPCGEIILRSKQFCNLTEVVARFEDTEDTLMRKVRLATILGTYQASLTNFPYLSKEWKQNCEEERLLGVSITGQMDCPAAQKSSALRRLKEYAVEINREYAQRFGLNPSTAVTCVKPSGTVSQLVDAASGLHGRHSPYYIRRIRISSTDGLFEMLRDQGVPYHPEVGQKMGSASTYVLEFPVKAPTRAVFRNDLTAIQQLESWKKVKENFTEHNPSVTISVGEDEWIGVANWLYENWEIVGGLSFLPREDYAYQLAPFEETDESRYQELANKFPQIDYSQILLYENDDKTEGAKEYACVGGACEIK